VEGNFKLVLAYDGTDYHGFQVQPGLPTVQGVLESALDRLVQRSSPLYVAGRTDAGVHARGQVVSFRGVLRVPMGELAGRLNELLPPDVLVLSAEEVEEGFHARHSARAREYAYYLQVEEKPSPFASRFVYWCPWRLNLDDMREAIAHVRGLHDFTPFSRLERGRSRHRAVMKAEIESWGRVLAVRVKANAFAWAMMRRLVGGLLEVGRGRWTPEDFRDALESGDVARGGPTLPPRGLFLERVYYGD